MMLWVAQGMGDGGGMMPMMLAMIVAVIVFVVLVIAGVIWLVRVTQRDRGESGRNRGERESSLQILDQRLARGEIDSDEYQERRSTLEDP